MQSIHHYLPRQHAVGVIELELSARVCVSVSALKAKPFDLLIMAKGFSGRSTVHEGNAGGT